jgi:RecA/RadA recombinase
MTSFTFRPAKREHTPLIVGLAGPTKSGKTFSAHRLAAGLAQGGHVAMINAEGAKGHQYADKFDYLAADIEAPFRPERYTEALQAALAISTRAPTCTTAPGASSSTTRPS